MMIDLSDKIALVTGGARGIGRGICLVLGEQGANVAVALRVMQRLGEGKVVVTVLPDTGERYPNLTQ